MKPHVSPLSRRESSFEFCVTHQSRGNRVWKEASKMYMKATGLVQPSPAEGKGKENLNAVLNLKAEERLRQTLL